MWLICIQIIFYAWAQNYFLLVHLFCSLLNVPFLFPAPSPPPSSLTPSEEKKKKTFKKKKLNKLLLHKRKCISALKIQHEACWSEPLMSYKRFAHAPELQKGERRERAYLLWLNGKVPQKRLFEYPVENGKLAQQKLVVWHNNVKQNWEWFSRGIWWGD